MFRYLRVNVLVTRFFAYGDGLDDYADEVSPFLFSYARRMNQVFTETPAAIEAYRQRFHAMVAFVEAAFPFGFRRSATGRASPRARFESIAVGTYLALQKSPNLVPNPVTVKAWIQAKEFSEATGSDGANAIGRLQRRMHYVRDHLLGA